MDREDAETFLRLLPLACDTMLLVAEQAGEYIPDRESAYLDMLDKGISLTFIDDDDGETSHFSMSADMLLDSDAWIQRYKQEKAEKALAEAERQRLAVAAQRERELGQKLFQYTRLQAELRAAGRI